MTCKGGLEIGAVLLPRVVTTPPGGIVLVYVPVPLAALGGTWTPTMTAQVPTPEPLAAGMVPPVTVNEVASADGVTVAPAQVDVGAGFAATVNPGPIVARLSVRDVRVPGVELGLVRVIVIG